MVQLKTRETDVANYTIDSVAGESISAEEQLLFTFNRYISRCITLQRNNMNMTQEELAQRSGVSRVTISAIEKRRRLASTEVLLKLLDALNLSIAIVERK